VSCCVVYVPCDGIRMSSENILVACRTQQLQDVMSLWGDLYHPVRIQGNILALSVTAQLLYSIFYLQLLPVTTGFSLLIVLSVHVIATRRSSEHVITTRNGYWNE
jgi:hypothetical protein